MEEYINSYKDDFDPNNCNYELNFENFIKLVKEFFDKIIGKRLFEYKPYNEIK